MEDRQLKNIIIKQLQEYDTDELMSLYNSYIEYQPETYNYISPMTNFRTEFNGFSIEYLVRLGQNSPEFRFNDDYYTVDNLYTGDSVTSFTEDEIYEYFVSLIPEIANYAVDNNVDYYDENIHDILLDYDKIDG